MQDNQCYKCKDCGFNFTIIKKAEAQKRLALHMYLEGMGFRAIGRVLKVSNVAVLNWVRSFGEKVKEMRETEKPQSVEVMKLDEMWHYFQKKRQW